MEVKLISTIYGLIAILGILCSQIQSIQISTKQARKNGQETREEDGIPTKEKEILANAKTYLRALETFDFSTNRTYEKSCGLLASSIKALIISSVTNFEREYSAPLFVYPTWSPEIFPEVHFRFFPHGSSPNDETDIDVVIRRKDGTLFAFKSYLSYGHETAAGILHQIGTRNVTGLFLKGLRRPVIHTVVAGIEFIQDAVKFSYLKDEQDRTQPLVIEVVKMKL